MKRRGRIYPPFKEPLMNPRGFLSKAWSLFFTSVRDAASNAEDSELLSLTPTMSAELTKRIEELEIKIESMSRGISFTKDIENAVLMAEGLQHYTINRSAAISNVAAVSSLSLASGSDHVDRSAFNTALTTLVTEINALRTELLAINAAIKKAGVTQ